MFQHVDSCQIILSNFHAMPHSDEILKTNECYRKQMKSMFNQMMDLYSLIKTCIKNEPISNAYLVRRHASQPHTHSIQIVQRWILPVFLLIFYFYFSFSFFFFIHSSNIFFGVCQSFLVSISFRISCSNDDESNDTHQVAWK